MSGVIFSTFASRLGGGHCPRAFVATPGQLARDGLAGGLSRAPFHSHPRGGSSKPRAERAGQAVARFGARSVSLSCTLRASEIPCPAGSDDASGRKKVRCDRCGGRGYTSWHPGWDNGCEVCGACGGSGKVEVN